MLRGTIWCCFFSVLCFSSLAQASIEEDINEAVELNRKIIYLISSESSNAVSQERDTFIASNFYVQKQHILERFEARIFNDQDQAQLLINALLTAIESDQIRAADALVFIDVVDAFLFRHNEKPFLTSGQLSYLHQLEQKIQLIQSSYSEDLAQITTALTTRGLALEPWQDYLAFLQARYNRDLIYEQFNQTNPELAEPATRGAEAKKDREKLVWGFGVPEKTVVLTFDDGPHYRNTASILDILKKHNVHGYFFAVGKNIGKVTNDTIVLDKKAELLKRALREGNHIANHSYSHAVLTKLSEDTLKKELGDTDALLKAVSGYEIDDYRPPYGSKNDALLNYTSRLGKRAVMWTIDSRDWADPVPESIVKRTLEEVEKRKKGILLFHDIHKQTVQALPLLLDQLQKKGYKVVTIDGKQFTAEKKTINSEDIVSNAVESQLYKNSWAVVIGVNKYRYWPQLSYAVNDAQGVADMLQRRYGFAQEQIITLFDDQATRENIVDILTNTLADPKKVKPDDRVFVFYAGHGMTRTLPSGRNLGYIIPVDAELDNFSSNSISMTHLQDFSDMIPAKHVYFVMDSCYSGIALTRGGGRSASDAKYLSEISNRRARQILTAGGADQKVSDGGPQGHSIFTWALLQGLGGDADLDENRIITASELAAYIAPKVSGSSSQTPAFGNLVGSEGGDFIFELAPLPIKEGGEMSELQRVKNALVSAQKENAVLKQQLAAMLSNASPEIAVRGSHEVVNTLSPAVRKKMANQLHEEGLALYKNKNYKDALAKISQALAYDPSNVTIVNNYGFILYKDQQYKNALAWLEKTIEMDADRMPVYVNIADVLVELERYDEAVPYYQYYLKLNPDSVLKERVLTFLQEHSQTAL